MTYVTTYDQNWQNALKNPGFKDFEVIEHGWEQHVLVDHQNNHIYRFPRTQGAAAKLDDEVRVLSELHQIPFNVAIPEIIEHTPHYTTYKYISGDVVDPQVSQNLSDQEADALGSDLGLFLSILHQVEPQVALKKKTKQTQTLLDYYSQRIQKAKDLPFFEQANSVLDTITTDETLVIVHGDLHGLNMVIDPINKQLVGVIDFSELELGDRHQDFRKIFMASEKFLTPAIASYQDHCGVVISEDKVKAWAFVNEWANIAYFHDQPSNPTYQRALKHLKQWSQY